MDRNTIIGAAAGIAAGAALVTLFNQWKAAQRKPAVKNVYVLVVRLQLKAGGLAQFKELWGKLAEHCRKNEPKTLSYELVVSDKDETDIMIYERYPFEADLKDPHQQSPAFKEFGRLTREEFPDLIVSRSRWTGVETNVGYM